MLTLPPRDDAPPLPLRPEETSTIPTTSKRNLKLAYPSRRIQVTQEQMEVGTLTFVCSLREVVVLMGAFLCSPLFSARASRAEQSRASGS